MNSNDAARTASLALGRSPYSKGAERLAADLGAKPTATLVNTRMEVPSPRNGRPAYRWVDGCYVVRPDGTKEFPPVRIREAWSRCASEGWAFKVVSESEYKEQTVTTKHTPGPHVMIYSRNGVPSHCAFEAHPHEVDDPRDCFGKQLELVASVPVQVAAAAPELLEALQALVSQCPAAPGTELRRVADAARSALAKATKGGGEK